MAPNPLSETLLGKRSSTDAGFDAGFDAPVATKKQHYHHQHNIRWKDKLSVPAAFNQSDEAIQNELSRSIALVLEAVGFERADPVALESFRALVEEYMISFLNTVRRSMLGSRRIQPVAQDFLASLNCHHLTLRSLLIHLDPPVSPEKSQFHFEEGNDQDDDSHQVSRIAMLFSQQSSEPRPTYIPPNFPALPSQHTYKAEAIYNRRELDPKTIRERATEEGRLGEDALRRLVSASLNAKPAVKEQSSTGKISAKKQSLRKRTQALWEETMKAVANSTIADQADGEMDLDRPASENHVDLELLGPAINADRKFWRRPVSQRTNPTQSS